MRDKENDKSKAREKLVNELKSIRDREVEILGLISTHDRDEKSISVLEEKVRFLSNELSTKEEELQVQKEELEAQKEELELQNEELRSKNEQLTKLAGIIRESEANLNKAERIAKLGYWDLDLKTGEAHWSEGNYRIYGYAVGGCRATLANWLQQILPDDKEAVMKHFRDAIDHGKPYIFEYRIRRPDGEVRWVRDETDAPIRENGEAVKIFGTAQDITERKQAEMALLDAKSRAEFYMDLMGHDINNMNQVGIGNLGLACEILDTEGKIGNDNRPLLEKTLEALENSSALIENVRILQNIKTNGQDISPINFCDLLRALKKHYSSVCGRDIVIEINAVSECRISANELVKHVYSNIISNSVKHSDPGKPLHIWIFAYNVVEDGRSFVKCSIDDDGPGIPDDVKGRLFNRFQRGSTKAYGKGLGLFIVKTLVDDFYGRVWVEDRVPGDYTRGSRFVVMLPAAGK